jgi:hypothetical protein
MRTRADLYREAADVCERAGRPDLAAALRALPRPGPKSTRDADGFTPPNHAFADLWFEMDRRIRDGEDEGDVMTEIARRKGVSYDRLCRLRALDGEGPVARLVRLRRRIINRPPESNNETD